MPSRLTNRRIWTRFDWRNGGEEWSENWGGTSLLWHGTLMPRIGSFLGDVRAIEIGPGYGRLTAYLAQECSSLVLVDIAPNCIEFCRRRFEESRHLEYFVNDGSSLSFLDPDSVDFVFSFDSLVHADRDAVVRYLYEIQRVLRVGGHAVLHHSNLAALAGDGHSAAGGHLRARDVSADIVAEAAQQLDSLECRIQELISWDATARLIDCISTFVRRVPRSGAPIDRVANPDFYQRARELRAWSRRYAGTPP